MDLADFRLVVDVHLMGAAVCSKAVWDQMRERRFGRIVMTTSSSGLYGNFGQANYGAAKMALVGLMQTLALEGEKYNENGRASCGERVRQYVKFPVVDVALKKKKN